MKLLLLVLSLFLIPASFASGSISRPAANAVLAIPTLTPTPTPETAEKGKRNLRPEPKTPSTALHQPGAESAGPPEYFYEFVRPGFNYSPLSIQHDEEGRGQIFFKKDGFDELITDPVTLSPATIGKIKRLLADLDFLNSNEEYQYERDFSNLGNVTFAVRKGIKERTVKYNWTVNKNAKELMDEYRRISNEYTWIFEFNVARVNQPLRTPAMMDSLDGFLRRNEISDPPHLVPYLSSVSNDEKLPLIARNHATKLIKQIEKAAK